MNKKEYKGLLIFLFVIWCLIPTVTNGAFESSDMIWYICLYLVGGYIRIYKQDFEKLAKNNNIYLGFGFVTFFLNIILSILFSFLGCRYEIFARNIRYLYGLQMVPIVVGSIMCFLGVIIFTENKNICVNKIAGCTFGVYLIHEHDYIRPLIWNNWLQLSQFTSSGYLFLYLTVGAMAIFIVCTLIELLRKQTIEKIYLYLLDVYKVEKQGGRLNDTISKK